MRTHPPKALVALSGRDPSALAVMLAALVGIDPDFPRMDVVLRAAHALLGPVAFDVEATSAGSLAVFSDGVGEGAVAVGAGY